MSAYGVREHDNTNIKKKKLKHYIYVYKTIKDKRRSYRFLDRKKKYSRRTHSCCDDETTRKTDSDRHNKDIQKAE